MDSATYWAERAAMQQQLMGDKALEDIERRLAAYYSQAIKDIQRDMGDLYDKLIAASPDGNPRPNDLYNFNRYYELQAQINGHMRRLGYAEIALQNKAFTRLYEQIREYTDGIIPDTVRKPVFTVFGENRAQQIIRNAWTTDGIVWSDRIWRNKAGLQNLIERGLVDSVVRGEPKGAAVKRLREAFNVGYYEADRIARTELCRIQNEGAADSFTAAGIEKYRVSIAKDSRVCQKCRALKGKEFLLSERRTGVNYPPIHPNCRDRAIAVVDVPDYDPPGLEVSVKSISF